MPTVSTSGTTKAGPYAVIPNDHIQEIQDENGQLISDDKQRLHLMGETSFEQLDYINEGYKVSNLLQTAVI